MTIDEAINELQTGVKVIWGKADTSVRLNQNGNLLNIVSDRKT